MRPSFPLVIVLASLSLFGCATVKVGMGTISPFQSIADKGDVLVTIDTTKEKDLAQALLGSEELSKRSTRLSVAFKPMDATYPLDTGRCSMLALAEGDYPSVLVNTALLYDSSYAHIDDSYYQKGETKLGSLSSNIVLLTTGEYYASKKKVRTGPVTIDELTSMQMAFHSMALYCEDPITMFDLGLGIPQSVVSQAKSILIFLDATSDGRHVLSARIVMDSPQLADSLNKLVRSAYVANLRRDKIQFSLVELKKMFTIDKDMFTITEMNISALQFSQLIGGVSATV